MTATDRPHLLLLPGLLNDARLWQHQVAGLADIADIVVGDLTGSSTITSLATAVLAQMPAERFALAGLSMGGYVAFEILRQAPQRISALALLDTTARPDTPQAIENRRTLMKLARSNFPAVIEALIPKMVHPSKLNNKELPELITAMAESVGQRAFLKQERAIMRRIDSTPLLRQIDCPTLVLCGRDDVITPLAIHQEMASMIPDTTLEIIDECGHLSPIGQPRQVTAALRKWLTAAMA